MKKTLDPRHPDVLRKRIERVDEESLPKWGEMSIEQCIHHLCDTFELGFGTKKLEVPPSIFLRNPIARWLVIDSPFPWPKGLKTPDGFIPQEPRDLESSKKELLDHLAISRAEETQFVPEHPVMGKVSKEQWQRFIWRHVDYHLEQFSL